MEKDNTMIRRLDPDKDVALYRQSWGWYEALPEWARQALAPYSVSTFEEFLGLSQNTRADIGVFDKEHMVAVVSLQLVQDGVYEMHLSSARRPPKEVILEAIVNLIKIGFEELNTETAFSFTPSHDRGIIQMLKAAGIQQDGVVRLRGTSRGRVVKWIRSIITRHDYESNIQANADAIEFGGLFANVNTGGEHSRHRTA